MSKQSRRQATDSKRASDLIPEVKHETGLPKSLFHFAAFLMGIVTIALSRIAFSV